MRLQLCEFCLKTGIYCNKCQTKLKLGKVGKKYIEIAKLLLKLESKYHNLEKISLEDVKRIRGLLVLLVGRGDATKFKSNPNLIRDIRDAVNNRIIITESGTSDRKFIEDLFGDQRIITINTVWIPGGTSETRVILDRRGVRRLGKRRLQELSKVSKLTRNIDLRIEYTH